MTGTRPPSPAATPTTIASSALPPRVRRVLQNLYDHIATDFIAALNAMLVEFEQQLFKQAEQARSNHLQAQVFVDLRALQKHRTELVPHYMFGLEAELAGIRTPRPAAETASALRLDYQTLTLVEDAVMDQEIVLREVARRHEQRGNAQILMLGQRFGVLARAPAYDADTLPLGPHRLCQVLKQAATCLQLSLDAQLVLYRTFDHKVMQNYSEWAGTVNQFLSREGILPGLVYMPRRVRVQEAIRHPRDAAAGTARPLTGWQGAASHWATLTPEQLNAVAGALTGSSTASGAGAAATAAPAGEALGTSADKAETPGDAAGSFEVLQKLLAIRRGGLQADAQALADAAVQPGGHGTLAQGAGAPRLLPTPDVLDTLRAMQAAPLPARTP